MKEIGLTAILSLATLLAACSAEQSRDASPSAATQAARNVINPSIPAVTVTARRMTTAEKLAYDHTPAVNVAGLQSGN